MDEKFDAIVVGAGPSGNAAAYTMAKAGLHAFTQHLAMELAEYGIRANAVAPAVVETPAPAPSTPMGWLESAASLLKREGNSDGDRSEEKKGST